MVAVIATFKGYLLDVILSIELPHCGFDAFDFASDKHLSLMAFNQIK